MNYKVEITDDSGKVHKFNLKRSSNTDKTLNDFILKALSISEEKR